MRAGAAAAIFSMGELQALKREQVFDVAETTANRLRIAAMLHTILKIAGLAALDLALLTCLILIPMGIPGNFIMLALALLTAWLGHFQAISWLALIIMLAMVILAEVVEAALGSVMARKYGASWWGVGGAFIGGITGVILGTAVLPLIGSLIGAFIGSAVGAVLLETWHLRRIDDEVLRAGWGAFIGKLLAALFKVSVGMGIMAYIIIRTH
ncbi:MAG: DUF456 domain-containing protein [bacterium]|nr:DUF456 domain-containing protein [bacterium]